jgi:hypothetical protein
MRWLPIAFSLALFACGGHVNPSASSPNASGDASVTTDGGPNICTAASPCVAGTSGCPENGPSVPGEQSACSTPGLVCFGYGTLSCPQTATCGAGGIWQITCPVGCGCADSVADAGACTSLPNDGYPQWWYSSCATTCGACSGPACRPAQLRVSPSICGGYRVIEAGCVPDDTGNVGNTCEVRTSDGEIIITLDYAQSPVGLAYCWEAGLPSSPGSPFPECPDGGGP